MSSRRTPLRPGLLQADIMRANIRPTSLDLPEIAGAIGTVSQLATIWGALDTVRRTADPTLTEEARALRYRAAWERAAETATTAVRRAAIRLTEAQDKLRREARGRAGLLTDYGDGEELRSVLRGLSQADRDAAIAHAATVGDAHVMAAVQAHELLVGPTTLPIGTITDSYVSERAPDEVARIADMASALEHLQLAFDQFRKSAEDMRDLQAEVRGDEGVRAAHEAEAALGAALTATSNTPS
jgi:hypothetical protein